MKTILLRGALFLLAMCLFIFFNDARAQNSTWEFSTGYTKYNTRNGVWYIDDYMRYPYSNNLTPRSEIISLRVPNWRASFVHLGEASNQAQWGAYELSTELANPSLPRCTDCTVARGYGDVLGLSIGRVWETHLSALTIEGEAGAFLYHGYWHESGTQLLGGGPFQIDSTETHLTPYVGGVVRYQNVFVSARHYVSVRNGLMGRNAEQVTVGVSVPF